MRRLPIESSRAGHPKRYRRLMLEQLEVRRLLALWSGDIPDGTVWASSQVQRIVGNVHVPAGATLAIQPGAVIKFNAGADLSLRVDGTLLAQGTSASPIFFTSLSDDTVGGDSGGDGNATSPGPSQWENIIFGAASTGSILDHVEVRYGGENVTSELFVNGGGLTLTNSTLASSASAGIRIQNSSPTLSSIAFKSNSVAASMDLASNPSISGVTMVNNGLNGLKLDGGTLLADANWDDADIVYVMSGSVTVPQGKKLATAPGQVVKFAPLADQKIQVDGTLLAQGTAAQPVYFTSLLDDTLGGDTNNDANATTPGPFQWENLLFNSSSVGSMLDHVELRYGGENVIAELFINGGALTLTNSTLANSASSGIRIQNSNPTLSGITFKSNVVAATMDLASNPAISGVTMVSNGLNGLKLDGGTLPADATWDDSDIVYAMSGSITVPAGRKLTIAAGQIVKFAPSADQQIQVNGTLVAQGTAGKRVYFTTLTDDTVGGDTNNDGSASLPGPFQWENLLFTSTSIGSLLDQVEVRYGGENVTGEVAVNGGELSVTNSTLAFSASAGIRIDNANPTISGVLFSGNTLAAAMDPGSNPTISNVTLLNNSVSALRIDGGTLTKGGTWNDPSIVYLLQDTVSVPVGQTLTIAAGQVLKIRAGSSLALNVGGTLLASGTLSLPIVFTSSYDDAVGGDTTGDGNQSPGPGHWNGIVFTRTSTASSLRHVEVRYAGEGGFGSGAIDASASIIVSDSTVLASAGAGLRVKDAVVTATNLNVQQTADSPLSMNLGGDLLTSGIIGAPAVMVDGGTFTGNHSWAGTGLPYQLKGGVTIGTGSTLSLGPGVIFDAIEANSFSGGGTITSAGLIRKASGNSIAAIGPSVINTGTVKVLSGTLSFSGGLTNSAGGVIAGPVGPTLAIGQNLAGSTQALAAFTAQDTVLFNGSGTSANPQLLEALSADRGDATAGFDHNFALYLLALTGGTTVKLVDAADNVPGGGAEAVYAEIVIVPSGATLDLNGLHLYARTAQLNGTIKNGTITLLPDGGPLTRDIPTVGDISTSGEIDDWTLFGRAGEALTITLGTGSSSSTLPISPQLNFAQVTLIDPSGNTLGSANNAFSGAEAALSAIALSSDGVYHIKVQASPVHATSTGHYVLTAWNATVRAAPLELGKVTTGNIDSPFATDRWTFAATGGQAVRFTPLAVESSAVQFDLAGPNGFTSFTNASVSSDDIVLPTSGSYSLTVHGSQRQTGGYAFRVDQTALISLTIGMPFTGSIAGGSQSRLFQLNVTQTQQLLVTLTDAAAADRNEIYIKQGSAPTRADYQYRFTTPASANQQVEVPTASPGAWYVLVYSESAPQPGTYSLLVMGSNVFLTAVTPRHSGTAADATLVLTGLGFDSATTVGLVAADNTAYPATSVHLDLPTQLTVTLAANSMPAGVYSVRVSKTGSSSSTLTGAFTLTSGGQAQLTTNIVVPNPIGLHIAATVYVQYSNTGDVPMPAPLLELTAIQNGKQGAFLTLDPSLVVSGFWTSATPAGYAHDVQMAASGKTPGILQPGESAQVPVYYAGWETDQWDFSRPPINFELSVLQADNSAPVDWSAQKAALKPASLAGAIWDAMFPALAANFGNTAGEFVRRLDHNAQYLGSLGEQVTDVGSLFNFEIQEASGFTPLTTLSVASDAALGTPGLPLVLEREYGPSLWSRNQFSRFGWGWTDSWQTSLAVAADGSVEAAGPGSVRRFEPDSRGGYFPEPGDYSKLAKLPGGGYSLTEVTGQLTSYNADGSLASLSDTNGNTITAVYTSGQLTTLQHSSGQSLTLTYNAAGLVTSVTDSAGRTTIYTYDATNQYVLSATTFDGHTTSYSYDTSANVTTAHALLSSTDPAGAHTFFGYDSHGRLAGIHQDEDTQDTTFSYADGRVTVANSLQQATTYSFDNRGLLAQMENPLHNSLFFTYDNHFTLVRTIDPLGQISTNTYDAVGNLASTTDPLGHTTRYNYSGANNRLTSITDARGITNQLGFDSRGNLITATLADGAVESYAYDPLGNLLSLTDARGQTTQHTYDVDGNILSTTFADGAVRSFAYDAHQNLISASDASGTILLTYNAKDELTQIVYPGGRLLKFQYDGDGRRTQMADETGFTVSYAYDTVGNLTELTDRNGARIAEYTYDKRGRLTRKGNGNGTATTYAFDAAGQLLAVINLASDGTTINSKFEYTYDPLGRRITESTLDGSWTYSYDGIGELTRAVFASTNPLIANQDLNYSYDPVGNRTQVIANGVTTAYTVNSRNEYLQVGVNSYTYDAVGNVITFTDPAGTTTYTYDASNALSSVIGPGNLITFSYDALGNRASEVQKGVTSQFLYDPGFTGRLISVYGASGGPSSEHYTYGLGLTSGMTAGGATSFYDFDGTGSTAGITNSSGAYSASYAYTPFGGLLKSVGGEDLFQFAGQWGTLQDGTGFTYMQTRSYNPLTGQFMADDPLGIAGGDINVRRYAANNPVLLVDPAGLGWFESNADPDSYWNNGLTNYLGWRGGHSRYHFDDGTVAEFWPVGNAVWTRQIGKTTTPNTTSDYDKFHRISDFYDDTIMMQSFQQTKMTYYAGLWSNCQHYCHALEDNYGKLGGHASTMPFLPRTPPPTGIFGIAANLGNKARVAAITAVASHDPNDKIGPSGFGSAAYVDGSQPLSYRIDFENDPSATAPAQRVTIVDQLDPNLDPDTFQLSEIGFGDTLLAIPPGRQHYETTVQMTNNGTPFNVAIEAGLRSASGQVFALFQSLDPDTQLPPDVLTGFLPPDDGEGHGQGHISYTIHAKANLRSGTAVRNVADIQFDSNDILSTDQKDLHDPSQGIDPAKQTLLTIDAIAPASSVAVLPSYENVVFTLHWSGADELGGSGIAGYDVFVSDNSGPYSLYQSQTTATSANFTGQPGHTYQFYVIATDNVGHVQTTPAATETTTQTGTRPWHNYEHGLDVLGPSGSPDGQVVAADALAIINYINAHGAGHVPPNAAFGPPYYDTVDSSSGQLVGDNNVVAADALAVINFINSSGGGQPGPAGEGEAVGDAALLALLANSSASAFEVEPAVSPPAILAQANASTSSHGSRSIAAAGPVVTAVRTAKSTQQAIDTLLADFGRPLSNRRRK